VAPAAHARRRRWRLVGLPTGPPDQAPRGNTPRQGVNQSRAVLAPEVQLLYKSTRLADKNRAGSTLVLPLFEEVERSWLRGALGTVSPGHPWLAALV